MKLEPVNSSVILRVGYDPDKKDLEVEFIDGDLYIYKKVPPRVYEAFMQSDSLGEFLNKFIKPFYHFKKLN